MPLFGRGRPGRPYVRRNALVAAAALVLAGPSAAIVYVMPTDESMVSRSPVIVFGQIRSVAPGPEGASPSTDYLLDIEEVLKGALPGSAIVVRQPGGVGADGMAMWIAGLPMLAEGDRVLLFLRPEAEGAHPVVEYALGMFWEARVGDRLLLLRESSLQTAGPMPDDPAAPERARSHLPRDAAGFRRWIADRATGVERPADYFETELPDGPVAVAAPYRLIRSLGAAAAAAIASADAPAAPRGRAPSRGSDPPARGWAGCSGSGSAR